MQHFHGSVKGFHVKTVDTTGAGDSFVGALLCKIVDDHSVLEVSLLLVIITFSSLKKDDILAHSPKYKKMGNLCPVCFLFLKRFLRTAYFLETVVL